MLYDLKSSEWASHELQAPPKNIPRQKGVDWLMASSEYPESNFTSGAER